MKKTSMRVIFCLTVLLCTCTTIISNPSYSETTLGDNPMCESGTFGGATSGSVNLQATWTTNTINLEWYDNLTKLENIDNNSKTCNYNGNIKIPTTNPIKEGYEFRGWRLVKTFDLSSLKSFVDADNEEEDPEQLCIEFASKNPSAGYCFWYEESTKTQIKDWGCTSGKADHLKNGEWSITFRYGTVRGEALCSPTGATYIGEPGNPASGDGLFCWCRANGFAKPNSSTFINVEDVPWVVTYYFSDRTVSYCRDWCPNMCPNILRVHPYVRGSIYGLPLNFE